MTKLSRPDPEAVPLHQLIDNTRIVAFRDCPRKYYWGYIRNLRKRGGHHHLIAGAAFAAGIAAYREAVYDDLTDPKAAAFAAFVNVWGDHEPPERSAKTFEATFEAILGYFKQFPIEDDLLQPERDSSGRACVEWSFATPLDNDLFPRAPSGDPYIFAGRFDMLATYNGLPVVYDDKTTSSIGSLWVSQWDLNPQLIGYCAFTGRPSAVVRGIAIQKRETKYATALVTYPKPLLEAWTVALIRTLFDINTCHARGTDIIDSWPQSFGHACTAYGGCPYRDLCLTSNPEAFIATEYEVFVWNPLEDVGKTREASSREADSEPKNPVLPFGA